MASGWGCQFLTKHNGKDDWCRRLKHKCKPACNGCILQTTTTNLVLTDFEFKDTDRKPKNRSDNPLA